MDREHIDVSTIVQDGGASNLDYRIVLSRSTPEVWVYRIDSNLLEAYSATESDRLSSIQEFVGDFLR